MPPYRKHLLRTIEFQREKIRKLSTPALRKKIREEFKEREVEYRKKVNKQVSVRVAKMARDIADRRLDNRKLKRTSYFDGIFNYMTMVSFAYGHELSGTEIAYVILLNLVPKLSTRDCTHFGFERPEESRVYLERLVAKGYCERFKVAFRVVYTASMKGDRIVLDFKKHYRSVKKELENNDEYKRKSIKWEDG